MCETPTVSHTKAFEGKNIVLGAAGPEADPGCQYSKQKESSSWGEATEGLPGAGDPQGDMHGACRCALQTQHRRIWPCKTHQGMRGPTKWSFERLIPLWRIFTLLIFFKSWITMQIFRNPSKARSIHNVTGNNLGMMSTQASRVIVRNSGENRRGNKLPL